MGLKASIAIFCCIFTASVFAQPIPDNDTCSKATVLPIQNGSCAASLLGTTLGAKPGGPTAYLPFAADDDVWYKFKTPATGPENVNVMLSLTEVSFTGVPPGNVIFELRSEETGLCENYFEKDAYITVSGTEINWLMTGLKRNKEYSIRLYTATQGESERIGYRICLYFPIPPSNDECQSATPLTPGLASCVPAGPFNTLAATQSSLPSGDAVGSDDDVWFSFTTGNIVRRYMASLSNREYSSGFGQTVVELLKRCTLENPGDPIESIRLVFAPFAFQDIDFGNLETNSTYYIRVYTYSSGSRLSKFNICVTMFDVPANDECANARRLGVGTGGSFGPAITATTKYASGSSPDISPCTGTGDDDIWFTFTAPASGAAEMRLSNVADAFDALNPVPGLSGILYSGVCNSLNRIKCFSSFSETLLGLTQGTDYTIRLMTTDFSSAAVFDIALREVVPAVNDDCGGAINVPVNIDGSFALFVSGSSQMASPSGVASTPCSPLALNDLWYIFTAPETGAVELRLFNLNNPGGGSTAMFTIVSGGTCASLTNLQCINTTSAIIQGLTPGAVYRLRTMPNTVGQTVNFSLGLRAILSTQNNSACTNARALTTSYQRGSTVGLSLTNEITTCVSAPPQNKALYYSITATATTHYIDFFNFIALSTLGNNLGFRVYNAPCDGNPLTQSIKCIFRAASGNEPITGLTIGNTYFVQLMENTFNGGPVEFDIRLAPNNANIWLGTVNNNFNNPANWSTNQVPGPGTEAIIPAGRPNSPQVTANTTVLKLKADPGTTVTVAPGITLTVLQ